MRGFGIPPRLIELKFVRAFYPDLAQATDAEIARIFSNNDSAYRLANPQEFFSYVTRKKLLPPDFDPVGYITANRDLWSIPTDWRAALHYVQTGRAQGSEYALVFDATFYRALYCEDGSAGSDAALAADWRQANARRLGSLAEALIRNGFQSDEWIANFEGHRYIRHNRLGGAIRNATQALVHFITIGIDRLMAVDVNRNFDADFWAEFCGLGKAYDAAFLYRRWVQLGRLIEFPANEAEFLKRIGVLLAAIPAGFRWRDYLDQFAAPGSVGSNKWQAFEHFITAGISEALPLPLDEDCAAEVVRAAADRFSMRGEPEKAQHAYDHLLLLRPRSSKDLQHAGDHYLRRGEAGRALLFYRKAREFGNPYFWTHANAAHAALDRGLLDEARDSISIAEKMRPRTRVVQELQLRYSTTRYDLVVARYISAMRRDPAAAIERLGRELRNLYEDWRSFFHTHCDRAAPRRRRVGADVLLKVVMMANTDLPQCTHYRVLQKQEQLAGRQLELAVFHLHQTEDFLSAAATADIAIFYRLPAVPGTLRCLACCDVIGIPTIYEIDDLVFEAAHFPEDLAAYQGSINEQQHFELRCGVPLVDFAMRLCDFGIASTKRLAGHMAARVRTGEVYTHRNALCRSLNSLLNVSAGIGRVSNPATEIVLFYGTGTKAHGRDFHAQLEPALIELMGQDSRVQFRTTEFVDTEVLERHFPGRVSKFAFTAKRSQYLALLQDSDINISVLSANEFNHCKSEIKWLEAAAFGLPSVASDVAGFRETLDASKEVVLCRADPAHWARALGRLIGQAEVRHEIGRAARAKAAALYGPSRSGAELESALRGFAATWAGAAPTPRTARRARILLVNVFFPPHSIGGATRVIVDQARIMAAEHADEFEIAVFCANHEEVTPYRLERYHWQGIDVYSVSTEFYEHMDWSSRDERVEPLFERVLDRFSPELIHFHAIQRLGVGLLERARARGIPYVVTVHDGWWISDHQFLLDGLNRVRMPGDDEEYASIANPHTFAESRARRLELAIALERAAGVYAVSEPFARIYRAAGIANVEAVPNGLPVLPVLEPTVAAPGKVRLGHLGGNTYHKGFVWLRDTLSRGTFENLELFVVAHDTDNGLTWNERWGATEVRWCGRVPLERAGWLHGQYEVLIAPSIWPESFGLAVREALAFGRWVVASDIGALGEGIIPGENGFMIDPANSDSLALVLGAINADIGRFRSPPPRLLEQRSVADQVGDLCEKFRRILRPRPAKPGVGRTPVIIRKRAGRAPNGLADGLAAR